MEIDNKVEFAVWEHLHITEMNRINSYWKEINKLEEEMRELDEGIDEILKNGIN